MTVFPLQAAVENPNVAMALAVLAGFGFGFMLEKAGFGDPRRLVRQFFGTEMVMLKVMFSAVATAVLVTAILHGLGAIDLPALGRLIATPTFLWPMIAGGLLIGVGIAFSGYCPGTDFVGIASGRLDALVVYGGVIAGQVVAGELDHWGAWSRFFGSGAKGQLFLYDLLGVPAAVLALAIALVAIGAFLFGEWVERKVAGAEAPASPAREKRLVFGALAGAGLIAVVTLALPFAVKAVPRAAGRIAVEELARRVFERPWELRVIDVRGAEPCGAARIPGSECVGAADVAGLGLELEPASRDLVFVGAGELAEPPVGAMAFAGRVLVLTGGFEAWKGWALTPPTPPAGTAPLAEQEAFRRRAGVYAAMTGVKPAAPAAAPAGGAAPVRKKAGGGGSGCGG
jgi:hypothetical protein